MNSTSYESPETIRQKALTKALELLAMPDIPEDANIREDIKAILLQAQIDPVSDKVRGAYPDFIASVSSQHSRSTIQTFWEEARMRGMKDNMTTRKIVSSIAVASLRMGMVFGEILRERGVDPVEALLKHAEAQTVASGAAHELRMVENSYDQYRSYVDALLEETEASENSGASEPSLAQNPKID